MWKLIALSCFASVNFIISLVSWTKEPVNKKEMEQEDDLKRANQEFNKITSDSSETLMYGGLGLLGAMLLSGKGKRK